MLPWRWQHIDDDRCWLVFLDEKHVFPADTSFLAFLRQIAPDRQGIGCRKDAEFLGTDFGQRVAAKSTPLVEKAIMLWLELKTNQIVVRDCLAISLPLCPHYQHVLATELRVVVAVLSTDTHLRQRASLCLQVAVEEWGSSDGVVPSLQDNWIPYSYHPTSTSGGACDDFVEIEDITGTPPDVFFSEIFPQAVVDYASFVRATQPRVFREFAAIHHQSNFFSWEKKESHKLNTTRSEHSSFKKVIEVGIARCMQP